MPGEDHYRKLERLYLGAPCNRYYAPAIRIEDGAATVVIEAREELFHAAGGVHGSVYFKALDDACFFAVSSLVEDVFVLTASFNLYLLRPVSGGVLTAIGEVVNSSGRVFLAEAVLIDGEQNDLARGSGSFVKSRMPLTPEMGYR